MNTLIASFYKTESESPNKPFLRQPFGDRWEVYTFQEAGQMARKLATGLKSLGLRDGAHIGLVSKNCREWLIADLAIMMAGYVSVPFFATLTGKQISENLKLGDVDALFVGKIDVWDDMKNGIPADMTVIKFPHYEGNSKVDRGEDWDEFMNRFEPLKDGHQPKLEDLWTVIFTSGTTGTPKGVMLKYLAPAALLESTRIANPLRLSFDGDNEFFSFLPMNHIAERAIVEGGAMAFGGQISFSESLATFAKNLQETQPTVFFAVPRIWTKFQLGILNKMPQKKLDLFLKIPILSGVVKNKLKAGLGLTNAKVCVSGAAPITQETKDWYKKIGILISEGYGMTENCAACSFLPGDVSKPGSVGKPQAGTQVRIDPVTSEVLTKSDYTMIGYYKSPEKSEETLRDGWLHTGDQGRLDEDGYLYLTGRVKDTFKTAKGEFIVPSPIELEFSNNKDIEQLCLLGLGLPQPVLLVVLSDIGKAKPKEELKESLTSTLKDCNKKQENYSRVSTVIVVNDAFTVENNCMTPSLKVKRTELNNRYGKLLAAWHEDKEAIVFEG